MVITPQTKMKIIEFVELEIIGCGVIREDQLVGRLTFNIGSSIGLP